MYNLVVVFKQTSSEVMLCGFTEGFPATVISIQVKVAAHFTGLSAPLMVHYDLVFTSVPLAVCRTVCHLADSDLHP